LSARLPAGSPWPLGVTPEGDGCNVAVVAGPAEALELCLFDPTGTVETARLRLPERTDDVWHGHVPGLAPGTVYGLRAHGPWRPARGLRCNPAQLLLDPYARALTGAHRWAGPMLVDPADPLARDPRDTAPFVMKAVVAPPPVLSPDTRPRTAWADTLIYEAQVRGLTGRHPAVPAAERGRYAALAHPAVVEHLHALGVTAVELMPVAAFLDEAALVARGLVNAWGYNPLAFMAAEPRYARPGEDPAAGLAAAVAALHAAGIEVILDVVLNHTAESDHQGPALSLKGLDNAAYYRLREGDLARYVDDTGTGNTLNTAHPRTVQLLMDALRRWAALGVDGFRFDLATVLGRGRDGTFDAAAPLLQAIRQDPLLGGLKLVAEPWDLGPGGYRLGGFPPPFAEWNDRFRDTVRRFWRGDEGVTPELAARLLGSADLLDRAARRPFASVAFVAAHDGFTAFDLTAYARRHNEANGEGNRDGHHESFSTNHGVEGASADPAVTAARHGHVRALLATLLLAQGTPMLAMGDERLRTQDGNNNAYCQDGPGFWVAWDDPAPAAAALTAFVARLAALRRAQPVLRRGRFLHGRVVDAHGVPDVLWLAADGTPLAATAWHDPARHHLVLLLNGRAVLPGEPEGAPLLLALNAGPAPLRLAPPALPGGTGWALALDSARPEAPPAAVAGALRVAPRALLVLAGQGAAP
jgi:glycogen operon protein